jgi:hypothetical protein
MIAEQRREQMSCTVEAHFFKRLRINPNPHGFEALTKAAAMEFKKPLLPHPCSAQWGVLGRQP